MELSIHTHGLQTSPALVNNIDSKVATAFAKHWAYVSRIRIVIEDVNGPRGGRDKRGQVVVELNHRANPIVATSRHLTVQGCINLAVRRASRALIRHCNQRHSHRQKHNLIEA